MVTGLSEKQIQISLDRAEPSALAATYISVSPSDTPHQQTAPASCACCGSQRDLTPAMSHVACSFWTSPGPFSTENTLGTRASLDWPGQPLGSRVKLIARRQLQCMHIRSSGRTLWLRRAWTRCRHQTCRSIPSLQALRTQSLHCKARLAFGILFRGVDPHAGRRKQLVSGY